MTVEQRIESFAVGAHTVAVEIEYRPTLHNAYPWTVRVRRSVPVHVTMGAGATLAAALDDVERTIAS